MRDHCKSKSFLLVQADVARTLNMRSGEELKEVAQSSKTYIYIVDVPVYKDCRILCIAGLPHVIEAAMRMLVPRMQEILRAKLKPTFETAKYLHNKSVVHIRSDFAAYLLEHASARLQHVADATHTHIYIEDVEEMEMATPLRRLHVTGAIDNVKAACNRLHQVQVEFEALPSDPTRLVYTLRLILLNRDVAEVNNMRMVLRYERLQVETKVLKQVSNLPNKTLFVLTGTLENLYAAHFATVLKSVVNLRLKTLFVLTGALENLYAAFFAAVKAIDDNYKRMRQRKDQPRDRDYSPDRPSYDKKQEYTSARHPSEERWTTKAILPTPPRVVTSPPPTNTSPLAVHVTPVVPPPATPFQYQPVLAPMPSAWTASASGWKLHDVVPASDAWSQDLDRLLQTGPSPTAAADNNSIVDVNNTDDGVNDNQHQATPPH
ncbi:hypothetical protein SDRG_15468 [Saprolegnia diclina VS20]|uniref:K Homology domain-containing protein n=1 Tax=Saprolegnia diclina (strain VS20) TaxID=1156394 RepID=T0PMV1_SAPDV|nr:hypothetical protein SDRG_15468 [Saprolegnia diclina VS20]EQC26739.1 hypothetical protein SDRG_15468 [Saprolegnia diclina VS20]|eukprot:XP_008619863.1 hypothetical protein SDRG_15468 [Saprolegnia diclina VS20]